LAYEEPQGYGGYYYGVEKPGHILILTLDPSHLYNKNMSETQLILVVALLIGAAVITVVYLVTSQIRAFRKEMAEKESGEVLIEWLKNNQQSFERQLQGNREEMSKQTKMIGERLDNAAKVIADVQKNIGGLEEFGKDMKDLSNVLKSPKLRGGLGEQLLYEILENFLPKDLYKTQYKFRDGALCDAVIVLEKGIIPIDSKFSMENFQNMLSADTDAERDKARKVFIRDVKTRIDEIASKYILPEENTTDYAIMYVPSENVFNEVANNQDIRDYAQRKSVALTSPNQFTYFVKTLMMAHRQSELSKHAGAILRSLAGIQVETEKFNDDLGVLDGHIARTAKSMDNVKTGFGKLANKIEAVQALGSSQEPDVPLLDLED